MAEGYFDDDEDTGSAEADRLFRERMRLKRQLEDEDGARGEGKGLGSMGPGFVPPQNVAKGPGDAGSEYSPPVNRGGAKPPFRDLGSEGSPVYQPGELKRETMSGGQPVFRQGPLGMAKPVNQPQAPPRPWTQAQNIDLQRLEQGLSQVDQEIANGTITEEDAKAMRQDIQSMAQPLRERKQQHEQQQQKQALQTQQQNLMHQAALEESINSIHRGRRAQALPGEIVNYTDPLTGRRATLVPKHNGDFEELKFERHGADMDRQAQVSDSVDYFPFGGGLLQAGQAPEEAGPGASTAGTDSPQTAPETAAKEPPAGEIGSGQAPEGAGVPLDEYVRGQGPPDSLPAEKSPVPSTTTGNPEEPHRMLIVNGSNQRVVEFKPDGKGGWRSVEQPAGAQAQEGSRKLNDAELAEIKRAALKAVPEPQWSPNPVVRQRQMVEYQKAVQAQANHYAQALLRDKQHEQDAKARSSENQRREEAKTALEEKKKTDKEARDEAKAKAELTGKQMADYYEKHLTRLYHEREKYVAKDGPLAGQKMPPHLDTKEAIEEEAWAASERMHAKVYPEGTIAQRMKKDKEVKTQADQFGGLMEKIMGPQGQPQTKAPAPDMMNQPSSFDHEKISQHDQKLREIYDNMNFVDRAKWQRPFIPIKTTLARALREKRPLTIGERKLYESYLAVLPKEVIEQLK